MQSPAEKEKPDKEAKQGEEGGTFSQLMDIIGMGLL